LGRERREEEEEDESAEDEESSASEAREGRSRMEGTGFRCFCSGYESSAGFKEKGLDY